VRVETAKAREHERVTKDWAWHAIHKQHIHDNSLNKMKRNWDYRELWKTTQKAIETHSQQRTESYNKKCTG